MIGRRIALTGAILLTLTRCGGSDASAPSGDVPMVAGTYDVTGHPTNEVISPFSFSGTLVLTQADVSGPVGGTMTLTYSGRDWAPYPAPLYFASVDTRGKLIFVVDEALGTVWWRGVVDDTAIVNGSFGCDGCYHGTWQGKRRPD